VKPTHTRSDHQLIEIQANTLFTHDERGRVHTVNEPDGKAAPRFFMGRTKDGHVWRFRDDLPEEVVSQLEALCATEPIPHDLRAPPVHLEAFKQALQAHAPIQSVESGPAYRFPDEVKPPAHVAATRMTRDNAAWLQPHFAYLVPWLDVMPPVFAIVQGGRAVSVCFSSRIPTVADEAGVETVEAYRGKGYAPAAVAGWAIAIRELGRIPLYSTDWDNLASQSVARKLGLVMYGADLSIM
jgi:RimJ/RimL family protein N-acetyltransferase